MIACVVTEDVLAAAVIVTLVAFAAFAVWVTS
jgi:hypothetical protein